MQTMKWCALALALNAAGCGIYTKKMSVGSPIDLDSSPGGPRYLQDGAGIDAADMAEQLEKEPEAASDVAAAQAWRVASTVFAAAGGALIGWPLGQALGGERKPLWALAGAGAGAIVVSIPLSALAVYSMDNAVKSHNRALGSTTARAGSPKSTATREKWMRPGPVSTGL
jgi:hypothetical protein